jgi:hypothetical protein
MHRVPAADSAGREASLRAAQALIVAAHIGCSRSLGELAERFARVCRRARDESAIIMPRSPTCFRAHLPTPRWRCSAPSPSTCTGRGGIALRLAQPVLVAPRQRDFP